MSKTIGIITNDQTAVFQSQVISGIWWMLEKRSYEIAVANTVQANADLSAVSLDLRKLDGVMVIANALNDDALRKLYEMGKPIALVSHQLPNSPIPAVIPDNVGGIITLVRHLARTQQRTRIAFVQGDLSQIDGKERTRTFQQELMRHNLDYDERLMLRGDFDRAVAADSIRALIDSGVPFDAVAAADYLMAIAAIEVLTKRKIDIPDPVCVIGFGDGPEANKAGLTTVGVDVFDIGVRAAKQLIGQLDGLRIEGVTLLATTIIERVSC